MADLHPYEDLAVRYLLGQLRADERREFETRLAESAELRALLRELEDGSVALAMAVPRRRPPAQIWKGIERIVAGERQHETAVPSFGHRWWRFGWAAAAVLLAGWVFHALWLNRLSNNSPDAIPQQANHRPDPAPNENRGVGAVREEGNPAPALQKDPSRAALEMAGLRRQIADLSNHLTQLSQSLAQQETLLLETNRLKFFQLTPFAEDGPNIHTPVSPDLQRALLLAMARELGWLPAGATNLADVDFVDLRPASDSAANPPPQTESQPANLQDSSLLDATSASSVPGFISGTNAVLAFDSSVVPAGTALSFWSRGGGQWQQLIGNSVLGQNPMVVTVPFSPAGGATLTVLAGNRAGGSNIVGQFPPRPRGP